MLILNRTKRSLVLSMILGDGCLHWSDNYNSQTGYLHIKHSLDQEDYLLWKLKLLSETLDKFDIPFYECESFVKATNKSYKQKRLQLGMRRFRSWYKLFYPNKKDIAKMLDYITDPVLASALWLGDDGSVSTGRLRSRDKTSLRIASGLVIYTCDQDEQKLERCKLWFKRFLNVDVNIKFHECLYKGEKKRYPILRFNAQESLKLWEQVRHILLEIPSMKIKFKLIEERYQRVLLTAPDTKKIVKT